MQSVTGKVIFIGILIILMLIPIGLIMSLVDERQNRYQAAVQEVSSKWGQAQVLSGPVMVVPYTVTFEKIVNGLTGVSTETRYAYFLPETLNYNSDVQPQARQRGIYEVVVYNLETQISGAFTPPDFTSLNVNPENINWNQAFMVVGLTDTRGIQGETKITINQTEASFLPGTNGASLFQGRNSNRMIDRDFDRYYEIEPAYAGNQSFAGIHVPISNIREIEGAISFDFTLDLKGSQSVNFWPTGKQTTAQLKSSWASPKFDGYFLPEQTDDNDDFSDGFTAEWSMSYYNRGYGQVWLSPQDNEIFNQIQNSAFGVDLIVPVDFYQKIERAVKYAILFIGLTFLTFFGFEVLGVRRRIHFLQYLLVGLTLSVFYLLLLSMSEYLGFGWAYVLSGLATISLITSYSFYVLGAQNRALVLGAILLFIYVYLYILLQLQDFALLLGSIMIFLILAVIMWITRKIDWYELEQEK